MREIELKAVVADWDGCRRRLEGAGARLTFEGELRDRRYDTADGALNERDVVLRLRVYGDAAGSRASLDWKGPTDVEAGYKTRSELSASSTSPEEMHAILLRLGYRVTQAIDRRIVQYDVHGAMVRLEHYPRMDDLVEVEGTPDAIERAIAVLGIPRQAFTAERLRDFAARYEKRTGTAPALSDESMRAGGDHDFSHA